MLFINSDLALVIAGVFSVASIILSLVLICQHLRTYTKATQQRCIVRILIIVPIYALSSWLSLVYGPVAVYFDLVRDCYEAYVIYLFMVLIVEFAGGESICATDLSRLGSMRHPFPLCQLQPLLLGMGFLRWCKQWTLQFVVVKPIMAVVSMIMLATGEYWSDAYQWTLSVIYNICYTIALFGLGYFYLGTRTLVAQHNPVRKFLAVKLVVFATYWQSLIVTTIPGMSKEDGYKWNDFILCIEMLLFAIVHLFAFSAREFASGRRPDTKVIHHIMQVISFTDVVADARNHFGNRQSPIEGYRGVSLLHDSERQVDVTDKFLQPGLLSDAPTTPDHHDNDDVSDVIDSDAL